MLNYNDFILSESFEQELDNLTLNEDLFHPMKTKRIKKALKDYQKAKVEIAREEITTKQKMEKVDDPEAKEKIKTAMSRKKEAQQELIDQTQQTLDANATTDSLKDLASYGKAQADQQALKIRIKAEENDAKKAELQDTMQKVAAKAKEMKDSLDKRIKGDKAKQDEEDKKNKGEGQENNNNTENNENK